MIETKFSNCIFPFCKRVKSGPKIARKAYKMDFSDGLGGGNYEMMYTFVIHYKHGWRR
jgi:hypothetical protein